MDSWMFLVAGAAVLLFVAIFFAGVAILGARPRLAARLVEESSPVRRLGWQEYLKKAERIFKPLGEMIPRSPEEMSRQERRLVQAGIRRKDGPYILYGVKVVLAVLLFVIFLVLGYVPKNPILYLLLSVLFGAMIPDLYIQHALRRRKERLQIALPDALDLAVICVEAGLGMDQALGRIGQELRPVYPELSDELNLYALEVNAGRKRADALRNMGQRTGVDDMKSFVAVLIQTDRFGTGIAQSLRVFTENMRIKRRQLAEEHAAKMGTKMLFPLVFFVFPAIFVVILGPAVISIVNELLPILQGR